MVPLPPVRRRRSPAGAASLPLLAALVSALLWPPPASGQANPSRREYFTPGLVVETGHRRGACDVLKFTPDGKHLLAVGDDKAVRVWAFSAVKGLEPARLPVLRWRTWHENRGNIYALALSRDRGARLLAIGGQGMTLGSVAVLDRATGETSHAFTGDREIRHGTVWSMDFAPSGREVAYGGQDGSVWVWGLRAGKPTRPCLVAQHKGGPYNFTRLVKYLGPSSVLSVSDSGHVLLTHVPAEGAPTPRPLFRFKTPAVYRAVASPDDRWLAAVSNAAGLPFVELRSLPGGEKARYLELPPWHYPHSVAFDPRNNRVAVGARVVAAPVKGANNFYKEIDDKVFLFNLDEAKPRPRPGPAVTYHPEALAFHPDGNHLAVAGGDDHELAVWDLRRLVRVGEEVRGPGSGLWAVALSPDARYLGFKDRRNRKPKTPNDRGAGPWKVFDLEQRQWAPTPHPTLPHPWGEGRERGPRPAAEAEGGWKIRTSLPLDLKGKGLPPPEERENSYFWFVESPEGKIFKLPLEPARDQLPRCYAFLPAAGGKPVRLAVGHLWGVSLFELTAKGPRLSRTLAGHEGEVMGLAVSKDQKRLVTVSRDETVAGWTLEGWKSEPELGATFSEIDGRLFVTAVDGGSPAWEVGLSKGDEVVLLVTDRKTPLLNRSGKYGKQGGDAKAAARALQRPVPGGELYFGWKRGGKGPVLEQQTTLPQRPLWRFFPTRAGEWVLWRWRDFYYDTSTNGDFLIGWQRNYDDPLKAPEFYRAEQFRREFHKPALVAEMLKNWKAAEPRVAFLTLEPPQVALTTAEAQVKGEGVKLTLSAAPSGRGENHRLTRVILWVNDHQFARWETPKALALDGKGRFAREVTVPRDKLRRGANLLTLQCYNHGDVRGEAKPVKVLLARDPGPPDLYGVFVGVGDYRKARPRRLRDLYANEDAQAMFDLWKRRAGGLYRSVHLTPPLLDGKATRANILGALKALRGKVRPDDVLVFHLGGHGTHPQELAEAFKVPARELEGLGRFLFCCADFDVKRLRGSTVNFEELYDELVKLPCHKLLLLDACHAGGTEKELLDSSANPVRVLTRDGVGPIILAACGPKESAYEHDAIDLGRAYGLFTIAVRRALEEKFEQADRNKNRALEPTELFASVAEQVGAMTGQLRRAGVLSAGERQTPVAFVPSLGEDLPLVRRPGGK
jgi:WD40 repeat protein